MDDINNKALLLDFEERIDSPRLDSSYITLNLRNRDISTNLRKKKFIDLKEKLDAYKNLSTKLNEI